MKANSDTLFVRLLRSPVLAGANVVFGVVAGMIAALFHNELFDAFPLAYLKHGLDVSYGPCSWLAFWFWAFLCAFAVIWMAKEATSASDRRREILALKELIENVAPLDFLELYEATYMESVKQEKIALLAAAENADTELRWVLDGLIQLAARWDYNTAGTDDVYRVNVMIDCADKGEWNNNMRTAGYDCYGVNEWPAVEAQAEGGLWVNREFATAVSPDGLPDQEVSPLLLV